MDGLKGPSPSIDSTGWVEYVGWQDLGQVDIIVRYPTSQTFNQVTIGTVRRTDIGIHSPSCVAVSFGTSDSSFGTPLSFSGGDLPSFTNGARTDFSLNLGGATGTFVKVSFVPSGSWLFLDELDFD